MANISLKNVSKVYPNGVCAVTDFSLEVGNKDFVILVGPSGCGKSTTLRMIAGLEDISSGEICIDGKVVNDVPPKDRDISMVFQNYALYPHMSVADNIGFSLKLKKLPKEEIDKKVGEIADILDIKELLSRRPRELSGGQKQRVAMGRAMVRSPKVFLMDEPLSNLDAMLRMQMRVEIAALHKKLESTVIYVTHDQIEAMTLGTKIVVMNKGRIQQIDSPQSLYAYPCNTFVAGFIGSPLMNFIKGKITDCNHEPCFFTAEYTTPLNGCTSSAIQNYSGQEVIFGIRPEDIYLGQSNQGWPAIVSFREILGAESYVYFDIAGALWCAKVRAEDSPQPGDKINVCLNTNKVHLFDAVSERRI